MMQRGPIKAALARDMKQWAAQHEAERRAEWQAERQVELDRMEAERIAELDAERRAEWELDRGPVSFTR